MNEAIAPPPSAADRPTYKGLLVPFTVKWYDGVPDFKVSDPDAVLKCVRRRLCGLWGKKLGRFMVFVGGPLCMTNKFFTDPAMHRACAEYALRVCPFLSGDITEMSNTFRHPVAVDAQVSTHRPDRHGLLETHACRFERYRGNVYIRAAEPAIITWWNA